MKRTVCIIMIAAMLSVWVPAVSVPVQADTPLWDEWIAATKATANLDENYLDAQGVYYTLDTSAKTAMVGKKWTITAAMNVSQYSGANDGVCIIPEKVCYNGEEYTVTSIEQGGFENNTKLKAIIVADTVQKIGECTFWNCSLRYLYLGANASIVGPTAEYSIFADTNWRLREIRLSEDNENYSMQDGILFSKDGKWLMACPGLREGNCLATYEVPDGVTWICDGAFESCDLREIILPESVKTISAEAFKGCGQLEKIDLQNVKTVKKNAFYQCDRLRTVNLPDSSYTLENCAIGYGCSIEALLYKKNAYELGQYAFYKWDKLRTLVVEEGTTQIMKDSFRDCANLDTVILPDSLTILKSNSFSNCPSLKRLYIPSSVTTISSGVLDGNDTVIYGQAGSAAQTYAQENEFTFVDVSAHDHSKLQSTTVFENYNIRVTADYCETCGYGDNASVTIKETDAVQNDDGEYSFSLSLTQTVKELDANGMDDQGVVYECNETTGRALVSSFDDGTGLGEVVIPEKVKKDGIEYAVTSLGSGLYNSERVTSLVLPDTIGGIEETSLPRLTLQYLCIGANVKSITNKFSSKPKGIQVSSANLNYYVKNHVLYQRDGEVVYDFSGEAGTGKESIAQKTTEQTKTEESESGGSSIGEQKSGEQSTGTQQSEQKKTDAQQSKGQDTDSPQSDDAAATVTLSKVSGIVVTSKNGRHIQLSWNAVQGASGYELYRSARKKKGYQRIAVVTDDCTTYTDKKVKKYKTYYYKVCAVSENAANQELGASSAVKKYCASGMQTPSLTVKKKTLSSGTPYLQMKCRGANDTQIELYCKRGTGRWKKVKLRVNRLDGHTKTLNIGYQPNAKSLRLRLRTCKTVKGKRYYSEYSKVVVLS